MKSVYVSASLRDRDKAREIAGHYEAAGFKITCAWWDYSEPVTDADKDLFAWAMLNAVQRCDVFHFIPPGGRGAHVELGAALALGKKVVSEPFPETVSPILFYRLLDVSSTADRSSPDR